MHQELNLFNDLTVAENLFLTREPVGRLGRIDKKRMHREAAALFAGMGVRIDPAEEVRNLKTSQKQLLEIAKALRGKAKLIILDEPTTALNTQEVDHLFAILRRLKEQNGTSFLFISHKMPEVFAFADRYTVLSDGRFVAEGAIADTTPETITEQMVGHPAGQGAQYIPRPTGEPVLEVRHLTGPGFADVSLTWSGVMNIFRHSAVIGALLGAVNGVLVGIVEMPAFIVTLATMLIYRSLAQYLCQHLPKDLIGGGSSVYKMDTGLAAYQPFYGFGNGKFATLPLVGLVLRALTAVFVYLSTSTKFGKKVYAIGSNQKGARLAGIHVSVMKTVVFIICGLLVGLGAFLWIAMNGSADPATTGNSYEMYAIASVVLGGISMAGGRGRCLGVLFGAMSYTVIDKIIVALKMDSLINDAIKGVILILVILIQVAGPRLKAKFGRR